MKSTDAELALRRAQASLDLRRYNQAIADAKTAIGLDPTSADAHAVLGLASLNSGHLEQAFDAAHRGLALRPDSEWLHRIRAHVLLRQKRFEEALDSARESVRLSSENALSHLTLGMAYEGLRRTAEAQNAFRRALALSPDNANAWLRLGDSLLDVNAQEAERSYREGLKHAPNDPYLLNNLGVALSKMNRGNEAAIAFKAAVVADPNLKVAKGNLHSTTTKLLSVGLKTGVVILIVFRLALVSRLYPPVVFLIALLLVFYIVWKMRAKKKKVMDLQKLDPQMHAIYEQLERDRKAGRL